MLRGMRQDIRRRGLLTIGAAAAGGTLAVAWRLGKPPVQPIYTPAADAAPHEVPLQALAAALKPTDPPAPLPAATLVDAAGAPHTLAEFAGRGLVLNLWATWCVPCVAELPALAVLAGRAAADGILVLPLSSDRGGAAVVAAFYQKHGITGLPVWLDPKGAAQQEWGARGIPTTLIVDRKGRERARTEGSVDWASDAALARIRGLVG
jgi:thiol-disulfide isomerase/thioredoxin